MQSKKGTQFRVALCALIMGALFFGETVVAHRRLIIVAPGGLEKASEDFIYDQYFEIKDQSNQAQISLLTFEYFQKKFPLPTISYDRKKHFGGWIHFAGDGSCLDTRGLVLQRDSKSPTDVTSCRVTGGLWFDHYTDKNYSSSADIQIDHVVPLKNAYMTGAYNWAPKKRCQYANYIGNNFHLLSVNGTENMRKGDRSPREYIPPNRKFTCQYLKNWLEIKYLWNLRLTPTEIERIQDITKEEHCELRTFIVPQAEISQQKAYMKANENICIGAALTAF